jgi:hypothetical protein
LNWGLNSVMLARQVLHHLSQVPSINTVIFILEYLLYKVSTLIVIN